MTMRRRASFLAPALAFSISLAPLLAAADARADGCIHTRPTDPKGFNGYVYDTPVASFGTGRVLVWYAKSGHHAPDLTSTRSDGVPDDVAHAAEVTDDALARYIAMGFRAPISDGTYPACASNGGDERLDVYLVDFTAADGSTIAESCTPSGGATQCASYILAKAQKGSLYASWDEAARTILPHETFHVVQNAYDEELDRFWAEGTAQWAAKALDPALVDLERNLPAFFASLDRSLDAPVSGVTAEYLYGAAIWPVFLTARAGNDIVRAILEKEGATGGPALVATDTVLTGLQTSLADEFATFSSWNVATGTRAGTGGYADAAKYPEAKLGTLTAGGSVKAISSGLAAFAYAIHADSAQTVTLDTDATRNRGLVVPLEAGKARLDKTTSLPATVLGDAIVVVTATTTKKSDAPFTLTAVAAAETDAGADAETPGDTPTSGDDGGRGGCAVTRGAADRGPFGAIWIVAITGVIASMRRRTRR